MSKTFFWTAACTVGCLMLLLQPARGQQVSEASVGLEKLFVDACRERLIGNYDKAISLLEDLLKKDHRNHAAMYELARVYDAQSKYEPAERQLLAAILLAPDNDWYKKFLADVHQKQGKFLAAAAIYEQMVKKEPHNEQYYFKWAYFLVKADAVDRAIKVYDELEKQNGIHEEAIRRKHALYIGMGNNKKAAEELQRLINAYPKRLEYRHLLAGFYEQIGDKAKAMAEYRQILSLAPGDAKAQLALAGGRSTQNDDLVYLQALKPAFENPTAAIDLKIGKLLPFVQKVADTRDVALADAALELTDILEKAHPGEAKPLAAAGDLLYHSGRKPQALAKYQKALQLDKAVFAVWEQTLTILYEAGQYKALLKIAEDAVDYFPNKVMAQYFYAAALLETGQSQEAARTLEQALLMAPEKTLPHALLQGLKAALACSRKDNSSCAADFETAEKLAPNLPYILADYAYYLCLRNEQPDKAKQLAEKALKLQPDLVRSLHAAGWLALKNKDYANARDLLSRAVQTNEEINPLLLEHLGDACYQTGDANGAVSWWTKAQAKGARSATLERKIAERKYAE